MIGNFGSVIGWVVEDGGVVSSYSCCFDWGEVAVQPNAFACDFDLVSAHSAEGTCGF